jgi:hypothetical protein
MLFWVLTLCRLVADAKCLERHNVSVFRADDGTNEPLCLSEMLLSSYKSTQHQNTEQHYQLI